MKFTVTASTEGPRLIVPDIATVSVTVKLMARNNLWQTRYSWLLKEQEDIELVPTAIILNNMCIVVSYLPEEFISRYCMVMKRMLYAL